MRGLALVLLLAGLAAPAGAQDPPRPPPPEPAIDATKLGVDLERIQKGLRFAESKEKQKTSADGLRLDFSVQVYGQAPRIDVLNGVALLLENEIVGYRASAIVARKSRIDVVSRAGDALACEVVDGCG